MQNSLSRPNFAPIGQYAERGVSYTLILNSNSLLLISRKQVNLHQLVHVTRPGIELYAGLNVTWFLRSKLLAASGFSSEWLAPFRRVVLRRNSQKLLFLLFYYTFLVEMISIFYFIISLLLLSLSYDNNNY